MRHVTAEKLIAFETRIKDAWEKGELPFLLHLCGGNEGPLIAIFDDVQPGDWIFSTHRSHYHYLCAGGSEEKLEAMIRRGDSMFVFDRALNFFTSSILASTCCIAVGVAHALKEEGSKNRVWCFLGDGAADEGHFFEAVNLVAARGLPVTFVLEDNDRSVDTDKTTRGHFEWQFPSCVRRYHYTPVYPHAGSGCKHHIVFKSTVKPLPQTRTGGN